MPAWAQDGGEDDAGGDVDGKREFGAAGGAVVEDGQDVQAGGADLDLLARTQRHGRSERPPAGGGGQRAGGAAGVSGGPGELVDEPVDDGLGRYRHRAAPVPVVQDPRDHGLQALDGALGTAALAAQGLLDRGDDAFVGAPVGLARSKVVRWSTRPHN
ncbi:hypothetical protein ABTZ90_33690 [Streptomyces cellulosae]